MDKKTHLIPDAYIETRGCSFKVWVCEKGITGIVLPEVPDFNSRLGEVLVGMRLKICSEVNASESRYLESLTKFFKKVLNGEEPLTRPEYCLERLGPFDKKVLNTALSIPWGSTRSYSWVARSSGNEHAARAVGSSLGRNPLPVVIPCHRVIRSNGEPGGYSGGFLWKKHLLQIEEGGETAVNRSGKN